MYPDNNMNNNGLNKNNLNMQDNGINNAPLQNNKINYDSVVNNNFQNTNFNQSQTNNITHSNINQQTGSNQSIKQSKKNNLVLIIGIVVGIVVVGIGAVVLINLLSNKNDNLDVDNNETQNGNSNSIENNNDNYDVITESIVRNHKVANETDFTYDETIAGVRITGYIGSDTIVVIPEKIAGKPVVGMSIAAFGNDCAVRGILVPSGVKELTGAFANNENLEVVIWESAEIAGANLFNSCIGLHTVVFGDKLRDIGENAFFYCPSLEEVYIPASVVELDAEIAATIFYLCDRLTITGEAGSYIEKFCSEYNIPFKSI